MTIAEAAPVAEASPRLLGKVDLALFAPHNEKVELLAEWNQFEPVALAKGEDGWWRGTAVCSPSVNSVLRFSSALGRRPPCPSSSVPSQ